jgi:hypothetical protein
MADTVTNVTIAIGTIVIEAPWDLFALLGDFQQPYGNDPDRRVRQNDHSFGRGAHRGTARIARALAEGFAADERAILRAIQLAEEERAGSPAVEAARAQAEAARLNLKAAEENRAAEGLRYAHAKNAATGWRGERS